nr:MAG TPA: hypothetical protein [Caudoviricetes sp.]
MRSRSDLTHSSIKRESSEFGMSVIALSSA